MEKRRFDIATLDNYVMLGAVALMLWLFPLYTSGGFFSIQVAKLKIMTATLGVCIALLVIFRLIQPKRYLAAFRQKEDASARKVDIAILSFTVIAALSTFLSPHSMEALTGFSQGVRIGRVQGFVVILMYLIFYLLISKKLDYRSWLLDGFLIFGGIASILAVLNAYSIDPLDFYLNVMPQERATFISTIGNINTFSSLACMLVALNLYFYVRSENLGMKVIYGLLLVINSGGLISAKSDSGLFAWAVLSSVMAIYFAKWKRECLRLVEGMAVTILTFGVIGYTQPGIEGLWGKIGHLHGWMVLLGLLAMFYFSVRIFGGEASLRKATGVLVGLGAAFLLVFVVAINLLELRVGGLEEDFLFGEHWGSGRMELYSAAWEIFTSLDLKSQLIGYGPDTYGILTKEAGVTYSTSSHSEYLQYLITLGWLGLISYCIFIVSAMVMGFRQGRGSVAIGLAFSCLAYSLQAIFNINQILTTPIFFILLAVMMATVYRSEK